ncbi:MAG: hypothetical protein WCY68_08175 [Desulfuromonadales bacterium]
MRRILDTLFLLCLAMLIGGCGGGGGNDGNSDDAAFSQGASPAVARYASYPLPSEDLPYQITVLGALGSESWAVAVNNGGQITGNYQEADGGVHAFFWDSGWMTPLVANAQAADLNDSGQVVGWFEGANPAAFLYAGGALRLTPDAAFSRAHAINDAGQVVGHRKAGKNEAFLEDGGRLQGLATQIDGYASQINDAGQIIVQEIRDGGVGALLLENGTLTDLGSLGGSDLYVRDLNGSGAAVGWGTTAGGEYHAFLWRAGILVDLAQEIGETFCTAVAIAEDGTVLIRATTLQGYRSYLWRDGQITDLENFGMGAVLVNDMNDRGQIVGWLETGDGAIRAFLATPKTI